MEQKKEPIYRSRVLDEMDVRTFPDGRKRIFSIKFVTKEGRLVYFPQAYACGAGRMNNKVFRVRGVQACQNLQYHSVQWTSCSIRRGHP